MRALCVIGSSTPHGMVKQLRDEARSCKNVELCVLPINADAQCATPVPEFDNEAYGRLATALKQNRMELLLLLDSGWEMMPAVMAAETAGVAVATLYGAAPMTRSGEVLAKFSHLHLVDSTQAAEHICRLGEQPSRIHIVGDVETGGHDGKALSRVMSIISDLDTPGQLISKTLFTGDAFFSAPWAPEKTASVSRKNSPEAQGTLQTRDTLVQVLRDLGIQPGDTICAHTSVSALGFVVGGARTIIEALISAVGSDGTVVMPAFSGDLSDPTEWKFPPVPKEWIEPIFEHMPAYDPDRTPTRRLGIVPEIFRRWPGARRSSHPQSSFAAHGRLSSEIVGRHSLDDRFGDGSPLKRLEDLGGKVVLLGAPWDTATIFYLTQFDVKPLVRVERSAPVRDPPGLSRWVRYSDVEYTSHWFADGVRHLIDRGLARKLPLSESQAVAFNISPALNEIRCWRREHQL